MNKDLFGEEIKEISVQKDEIVERVINKLRSRSEVGVKKYNTTLFRNTDENYIKHIQEECLDAANYCEQMLRLGEFTKDVIQLLEYLPNDLELGSKIRQLYIKLMTENER